MSKLKGTNIASPIVPYTDSDIYPTHLSKYGKGGYRTAQNYEELTNIPEARLEEGMLVYLMEQYKGHNFYQYRGNGVWEVSDIENDDILNFDNPENREYDVKVEGDSIKVRNELGDKITEGIPDPGQFSSLKINSFYLGRYGSSILDDIKHDFLPCSHKFIELANVSDADISLNGLYLFTFNGNSWNKLKLTGIIPASSTYLIRGAQCSVLNSDTTYIKVKEFNQEWTGDDRIHVSNTNGFTAYLCWCTEDGKILGNNRTEKNYPESYSDIYYNSNPSFIDCVSVGENNRFSSGKSIEDNEPLTYSYKKIFIRRYPMDPDYVDTKDNRIDWRWHRIVDDQYRPAATYEKKNLDWGTKWMRYDKPLTLTCTVGESVHIGNPIPDGSTRYASRCFTWVSSGVNDEYLFIRRLGETTWAHFGSFHGDNRGEIISNIQEESLEGFGWFTIGRAGATDIIIDEAAEKYYNRCQWETFSGDVLTTHRVIIYCENSGEFEYCCGKMGANGNPDLNFVSDIQSIRIFDISEEAYRTVTIGNQFICNQEDGECWNHISTKLREASQNIAFEEPALVLCTGNMVSHGNRPGEWVTYINNNDLHRYYAEFITPGTNDLGGVNLYSLSDEKLSPSMFSLFYTFELPRNPELRMTIPNGVYKDTSNNYAGEIIVPGYYVSYFGDFALCSINSAISTSEENHSTIHEVYGMGDEEALNDVNWSKVDYEEHRKEYDIVSSRYYRGVMNWIMNNFTYFLKGSNSFRGFDNEDPIYARFIDTYPGLYRDNMSLLVKARRFIVLTNYPPLSPSSYDTIEGRNTDDVPDRMGENIELDNLNSRLYFGLSRLFKCLNIHYVLGSSSFASTLISRPIFDAQGDNSATPFNVLAFLGGPEGANKTLLDDIENIMFSQDTFHPTIQCTDEDTLAKITVNGFRKLLNDTNDVVMNVDPQESYFSDRDGILDIYYIVPKESADHTGQEGLRAVVAPIYLLIGTTTTNFSNDGKNYSNVHPLILGKGIGKTVSAIGFGEGGWFNSANDIKTNCTPTAFLMEFGLNGEAYPTSTEPTETLKTSLIRFNLQREISNGNDYLLNSYWNTEIRPDYIRDLTISDAVPMSSVNGD